MKSLATAASAVRGLYGARPLHLLLMCLSIALAGYVVSVVGPAELLDEASWWQSIAVWFLGAAIMHDLVVFPLYAIVDRLLTSGLRAARERVPNRTPPVSPLNYIRCPLLASGLTLLLFFPGIIEQGSSTFTAATGLTQQPYLQRFLLLTTAFFAFSCLAYVAALVHAHRRRTHASSSATDATSTRSGLFRTRR